MNPFDYSQPFPSRRSPTLGRRGAVATSHPLAAQAGMKILMEGGNAVDAALAAAAALTVVEPTSNGLGGDAFVLVWDGKGLYGLNASGRAPLALTPDVFHEEGLKTVPTEGWLSVTVPGAVSGWMELSRRFGSMPLMEVLKPAIEMAEEGHAVPPVIAGYWKEEEKRLGHRKDFREAFLPGGRAPRAGEVFRLPELGHTLRLIGESNGEVFYRGEIAEQIVRYAERTGGYLTLDDLRTHRAEWVDPISSSYRGFDLWEIPPNGQGITAQIALNILEGYELGNIPQLSAWRLHLVIEALKLAFADAHAYVADPAVVTIPVEGLLSKDYARRRRAEIKEEQAIAEAVPGLPRDGDTVYLCTADARGWMVSFIQSNYLGFGSGVVVPGTGIAFQSRGACFTLEEGHPNRLAPRKRPYHTIIPGFITKEGVPLAAFGVMGGDMQPQGHVQVMSGIVDYGLNPQAAVDAPRVRVLGGRRVALEPGIGAETARQLARWGHEVRLEHGMAGFGGGQMIWRDPQTGVLICGSEPRKDGQAVVW